MKKILALIGALALLGVVIALFLFQKQASADAKSDFSGWQPSALAIRQKLGTAKNPAPELRSEARYQEFQAMFVSRFRSQNPMVAVGFHYLSDTKIKLMCPARMEPWNIDAVALMTWREAKEVLGTSYDIDIYETYLGGRFSKVGELRPLKEDKNIAHIVYYREGFPRSKNAGGKEL